MTQIPREQAKSYYSCTTKRLIIMGELESSVHYLSCYNDQNVIDGLYKSSTNTLAGNTLLIFQMARDKVM